MKKLFYSLLAVVLAACGSEKQAPIDREALVARNNPQVSSFDSLASLSVGNGEFAFTVDATGLQTFPLVYKKGVPLGTQSQWGWHSFGNPNKYKPEEYLKEHDFGRGHKEIYACQFKEDGRQKEASNWYRMNPHRLHLGIVGLELGDDVKTSDITDIAQTLDMWNGVINSHFTLKGNAFDVQTVCHPQMDMISASITSPARAGVKLHFPYPTGAHADDACNWDANNKHTTDIVFENAQSAVLKRTLDSTVYYVSLRWEGKASLKEKSANYFVLTPAEDKLAFSCKFTSAFPGTVFESEPAVYTSADTLPTFAETLAAGNSYWNNFWKNGAAVDFSHCTDPRAKELERRVVLSQYLLAIQSAGSVPPQETGLTYNSWFGKFHLEMIWWHQAWQALWGHPELLDRTLGWYETVEPVAREIARRQGFDGVRWMKIASPNNGTRYCRKAFRSGASIMSKEMAVFTFITAFNSLPLFHFSALNIISSMFFWYRCQYQGLLKQYCGNATHIPAYRSSLCRVLSGPGYSAGQSTHWLYLRGMPRGYWNRPGCPRMYRRAYRHRAHWD